MINMQKHAQTNDDPALLRARRAGQILKGLIVGFLFGVAIIELLGQIGNLSAFQYQGF
ncbi:hypothetical protein ACXYMO_15380 [Arenibacterium sp. CAU 1754]